MKLRVTPAILAKMATLKRDLVLKEQTVKGGGPAASRAAAEPGPEAGPQYHAMKAAEAAVYKRDIDTATRRRLASEGKALPERLLPDRDRRGPGERRHPAALRPRRRAGRRPAHRPPGEGPRRAQPAEEEAEGSPARAAEPDVAKCKCTAGMMDGSPARTARRAAGWRKRTAKAAAPPAAAKKKGKLRAVCPNCGAKQNPDHAHCPECGHQLPPQPPMVAKNHDFMCLGCGKELDKGEKYCPGCGKENPGHNPMADLKIPANADADKSAGGKDRVAKAKKKSGKKGKAVRRQPGEAVRRRGRQAGRQGQDAGPRRRSARGRARAAAPPRASSATRRLLGLPAHREPDGMPVEEFEHDAAMEDGDR